MNVLSYASDILELLNRNSYILQNFQPIPVQSCNWLNDQWKVEIYVSLAFQQAVVRNYDRTQGMR